MWIFFNCWWWGHIGSWAGTHLTRLIWCTIIQIFVLFFTWSMWHFCRKENQTESLTQGWIFVCKWRKERTTIILPLTFGKHILFSIEKHKSFKSVFYWGMKMRNGTERCIKCECRLWTWVCRCYLKIQNMVKILHNHLRSSKAWVLIIN